MQNNQLNLYKLTPSSSILRQTPEHGSQPTLLESLGMQIVTPNKNEEHYLKNYDAVSQILSVKASQRLAAHSSDARSLNGSPSLRGSPSMKLLDG